MVYPSGLITGKVVKNQSGSGRPSSKANTVLNYTKHYYAGSQRVASKTGVRAKNLGHYYPDYIIQHYFPNLDENSIRGPSNDLVDQAGETLQSVFGEFGITQAIPNPVDDGVVPRFIYTQKRQIFYFHPDHLGSSNYITNLNGNISQHMEYLPFGEMLVEEHKNSNNSPFKFNGKELDEETGNYYYGARYYDPKFSIWLSVDPMAGKYPGWSPYNYTLNSPINLTDPDGRSVDDCTGCPDNAKYGEQVSHKEFGELTYNGNYWENSQGSNVLDEVVITAERSGGKSRTSDGIKIWNDIFGNGENIGLNKGKSGSSINASTMATLGGNPTGAGGTSTVNKILGLAAAILSPISDWLDDDNSSTKKNQNTTQAKSEKKELDPDEKIFMRYYNGYDIYHYGPSGKSGSLNTRDTTIYRKDSLKLQKKNEKVKREYNSHFE